MWHGGRQQDGAATLSGMMGQQLIEQGLHVMVIGMDFIDNQYFAGQAIQTQRLVAKGQQPHQA